MKANILELEDTRRSIPNYPENRADYAPGRKMWDWRGSAVGQDALVALFYFVEDRMNLVQIITGSEYAKFGVTAETTYNFLKRAVPQLFEEYERDMGKPMAQNLPIKRMYMWFLDTRKPQGGQGCDKVPTKEWPPMWATPEQLNRGLAATIKAG